LLRLHELVAVRVLLGRALVLDEVWEGGALHEAFISLDDEPAARRARTLMARADALFRR